MSKEKIQESVRSDISMLNEIAQLKRSNSSFKGSNTKLINENDSLKAKCRDLEGKLKALEEERYTLLSSVDAKSKTIKGFMSQIEELTAKVRELEANHKADTDKINDLEFALERAKMPWWKKFI